MCRCHVGNFAGSCKPLDPLVPDIVVSIFNKVNKCSIETVMEVNRVASLSQFEWKNQHSSELIWSHIVVFASGAASLKHIQIGDHQKSF